MKTQDQMLEKLEQMSENLGFVSSMNRPENDAYHDGLEQGYKDAIMNMRDFLQE